MKYRQVPQLSLGNSEAPVFLSRNGADIPTPAGVLRNCLDRGKPVYLLFFRVSMVGFEDVKSAAACISGIAHRTPVMTSRLLDDACGGKVFLKCESFQRGGAFKFRGAYYAVSRLSAEERHRGVVTYSSGNHGQALALVGRMMSVRATIVMPENAPSMKIEAVRAYGAEAVLYNPANASRKEIAERLSAQDGYTMIPPFDHPDIIAGQGTAAMELLEEVGPLASSKG